MTWTLAEAFANLSEIQITPREMSLRSQNWSQVWRMEEQPIDEKRERKKEKEPKIESPQTMSSGHQDVPT